MKLREVSLGWIWGMHSHERNAMLQLRRIGRFKGAANSRSEEVLLIDPFGRPRR